jgi:aldose 1-epimerase
VISLVAGTATVAIDVERGCRLGSLCISGRELLIGPPNPVDRSFFWGSFLMAPWAGRIADGLLTWDGSTHRLPRRDGRHAIHGVTYDRPWTVERSAAQEVSLTCELGPAGWPLGGLARQRFGLYTDHLVAEAELVAERPMPAALGWHPWLRRPDGDLRLSVEGEEVLETVDLIPTGRRLPVDARADLRGGPPIGDRRLDHVYVDPASPAVVRWPDLELLVEFAPPLRTLVVHSRPGALCVEPQTAWPNAPALARAGVTGTGIASLGAGDRLRSTMTLRWRATAR